MIEELQLYRSLRGSAAELLYGLVAIRAAVQRGDMTAVRNELLAMKTHLDLIIDDVEKLGAPS